MDPLLITLRRNKNHEKEGTVVVLVLHDQDLPKIAVELVMVEREDLLRLPRHVPFLHPIDQNHPLNVMNVTTKNVEEEGGHRRILQDLLDHFLDPLLAHNFKKKACMASEDDFFWEAFWGFGIFQFMIVSWGKLLFTCFQYLVFEKKSIQLK
mmetsp:Transcript_26402/g.35171  ORF Transcript_26402/g.35171 Transcript_26402/m.35171 type:complete len:152 (-) Transcript_26402:237-692(-)